MRKLYLIVASLSSKTAHAAVERHLAPYRNKKVLTQGVWLLPAIGNSTELLRQLMTVVGQYETVLVVKLNADMAWNHSSTLHDWLALQLAALSQ